MRIPRKNVMELCGRPAIAYPVAACLESGVFDRVIVSTDDEEIAAVAAQAGAEVSMRPAELATDQASIHQVMRHLLLDMEAGGHLPRWFCIVYATAVLLEARHLRESRRLLDGRDVEGVLAVSELRPHPHKALREDGDRLVPVFPEEFIKKSQQMPDLVAPAGAFHWMASASFLHSEVPVWERPRAAYRLAPHEAVDLDEPQDLELVRRLLAGRERA